MPPVRDAKMICHTQSPTKALSMRQHKTAHVVHKCVKTLKTRSIISTVTHKNTKINAIFAQ